MQTASLFLIGGGLVWMLLGTVLYVAYSLQGASSEVVDRLFWVVAAGPVVALSGAFMNMIWGRPVVGIYKVRDNCLWLTGIHRGFRETLAPNPFAYGGQRVRPVIEGVAGCVTPK